VAAISIEKPSFIHPRARGSYIAPFKLWRIPIIIYTHIKIKKGLQQNKKKKLKMIDISKDVF
jgi:hypothetical protein